MADIVDYAEQKAGVSFEENSFNEIDGLVLSELTYVKWERINWSNASSGITMGEQGISLNEAIKIALNNENESLLTENQERLLRALEGSERYGSIVVSNLCVDPAKNGVVDLGLEDGEPEQFCAMTFSSKNKDCDSIQHFIAYRGTDNTLEGWYEDFLMAYDPETQAQTDSTWYVNQIADMFPDGDLRLGGHSKGGNDTMHAFLHCDENVRDRVVKLYSYDGPGLHEDAINEHYGEMLQLLEGTAIAPFDSVIGNLLVENGFQFVDTNTGILADHDGFSWQIDIEGDQFVQKEQSALSKYLDETFDDWLAALNSEERKVVIDTVWGWIYTLGCSNFDEVGVQFAEQPTATIQSLVQYIADLDEEQRTIFLSDIGKCLVSITDNFLEDYCPGYENVRGKLIDVFMQNEIYSFDDLKAYFLEEPVYAPINIMSELITDLQTVEGLGQMFTAIVTVATVTILIVTFAEAAVCLAAAGTVILMSSPVVKSVASAVIAILTVKSSIEYVKTHWQEVQDIVLQAGEYVQEKINAFVETVKLEVTNRVNEMVSKILCEAESSIDCREGWTGEIREWIKAMLKQLGDSMSTSITITVAVANPIMYSLVRIAGNLFQQAVTIDMPRLQNAVNQMDRLATRVQKLDESLNGLYRKLCINSIEQGEGVFTSLANMYQIFSADINVDDGWKIRRKANAISELFRRYDEIETWIKRQL